MRWPLASVLSCFGCAEGGDPPLQGTFTDRFERDAIGADYRDTSDGAFRIEDGALCAAGARNHPLWLRRRLPDDVRVELAASSASPDGDIKFEIFGDGRSHATADSYTATAYVLVFGGWRNSLSAIARLDEHGADRKTRRTPRVEPNRRYRMSVERRGSRLVWRIDGATFLETDDPQPLRGPGHDHFAFNDWDAPLCFDDLVVTPL
jgi:hypothetical protein